MWRINADEGNIVYDVTGGYGWGNTMSNFGKSYWKDYAAEFRFKILEDVDDDGFGILLYVNDSSGLSSYMIRVTDDISFVTQENGGPWHVQNTVNFSFVRNRWYWLRAEVEGNRIRAFADDRLLIDTMSSLFGSGKLAFNIGPNTHVLLDNIRVWSLDADD